MDDDSDGARVVVEAIPKRQEVLVPVRTGKDEEENWPADTVGMVAIRIYLPGGTLTGYQS